MLNLIANEFFKVAFKKRTYISFLLITILIPIVVIAIDYGAVSLQNKIYGQMQDSFLFVGSLVNGNLSAYIIITILIIHMPFLSTIVPSEIISGEYSEGTFRMYLTRPVTRRSVFFAKLFIVFLYTIIMMLYFFIFTILISLLIMGWGELIVFHDGILILGDNDILWRFLIGYILSSIVMLSVASLCLLFSSFSNNSVTPIISTISFVFVGSAISYIPIDLFELINPFLFTGYINIFSLAFFDPLPINEFINCVIVCIIWSTIFILLAFINFIKKDIVE